MKLELLQFGGRAVVASGPSTSKHAKKWLSFSASAVLPLAIMVLVGGVLDSLPHPTHVVAAEVFLNLPFVCSWPI